MIFELGGKEYKATGIEFVFNLAQTSRF